MGEPVNYIREKRDDFDQAVVYSHDDTAEEVRDDDLDEAVQSWLDARDWAEASGPLPETVTIFGYKRMDWAKDFQNALDPENLLTEITDPILEEYGDPHGDNPEPSRRMKKAAEELSAAILADLEVWACTICGSAVIDVQAWLAVNDRA